jgi:hypothetical protein
MAILPDWLTSGQYGGGLLHGIGAPSGERNILDPLNRSLSDNSMLLIGLGGDIMRNGFRSGLGGAMQGATFDRQAKHMRQAHEAALGYAAGHQGIDPQLKAAMLQDPGLAVQYLQRIAKPPEFKTAGPYFGIFQNGEFKIQGTTPEFKSPDPHKTAAYYSAAAIPGGRPTAEIPGTSKPKDPAAADLDFVNGIAKIFDPNSVVRKGEMKLVGKAQAIPEDVQSYIKGVAFDGGRLTPQGRVRILEVARTHLRELKRAP